MHAPIEPYNSNDLQGTTISPVGFCTMRTRLTLPPGHDGAQQMHAKYGDRLVCVRYRYDERRQKRFKTVELERFTIAYVPYVGAILVIAPGGRGQGEYWAPQTGHRLEDALVWVRVALPEVEVRRQVKRAGGRWDPHRCLWELRYEQVIALGLSERIVSSRG